MATKNNKLYIGSRNEPIKTFENDTLTMVKATQVVNLIGEELAIDTLSANVIIDNTGKTKKKTIYLPKKFNELPEGYTAVEYISGGDSGSAIDFGIPYGNEFEISTVADSSANDPIIQCMHSAGSDTYIIEISLLSNSISVFFGQGSADTISTGNGKRKIVFSKDSTNLTCKANNVLTGVGDTITHATSETDFPGLSSGSTITLGTKIYFDIGQETSESYIGIEDYTKVYSFSIKKSGIFVVNCIPVIRDSDNKAGLYDYVSGEFFTSVLDDFAHGSEIETRTWTDGYLLHGSNKLYGFPLAYDISKLPYSTPLWWYNDNKLVGKFFYQKAIRQAKNIWELNGVSKIGILDKQTHYGGVYSGQEGEDFLSVANEILGIGTVHTWYQAVDYIASDGNAWMNTYVTPEDDVNVYINMKLDSLMPSGSTNRQYFFGCVNTAQISDEDMAIFCIMLFTGYDREGAEEIFDEDVSNFMEEYEVSEEVAKEWVIRNYLDADQLTQNALGWSYAFYQEREDGQNALGYTLRNNAMANNGIEDFNTNISGDFSIESKPNEIYHNIGIGENSEVNEFAFAIKYPTLIQRSDYLTSIPLSKIQELVPSIAAQTQNKYMYLFGLNVGGDARNAVSEDDIIHPAMRVYGCKIYQGESVIRDLRPCYRMSDNKIGMYDVVSKQFYSSIGTSEFTKGADVSSEIEELNGQQHHEQESEFSDIPVFGWLPIDSRRNNLYRLLLAYGINLVKDDSGNIKFVKMNQEESPYEIPDDRVYDGGTYEYDDAVNKIEITEHSFQGTNPERQEEIDPILLFDTEGQQETDVEMFVAFDKAPIMTGTLTTTSTLQLLDFGVNWAKVTGSGQLWGKPYDHLTKITTKSRELNPGEEEKLLTVRDACLVNVLNSSNLINRLWAYYTATEKIKTGIILGEERCGNIVTLTDPFEEKVAGYLSKMEITASSTNKADCEIIKGYSPSEGKYYTDCVVLTNSGTWTVPEGVTEFRAILIGGGEAGSSGEDGEDGQDGRNTKTFPAPAHGGEPGKAGRGGKVKQVTYSNVSEGASYSFQCGIGALTEEDTPTATVFGNNSSATGGYVPRGIVNMFTGEIYGAEGVDGVKGGNSGGYNGSLYSFVHSENVTFRGQTYLGGEDGRLVGIVGLEGANNFSDTRMIGDCYANDGLGGGAAVGNNGSNANSTPPYSGNKSWKFVTPEYPENYNGFTHMALIDYISTLYLVAYGGDAADGADAIPGIDARNYGCGGYGGHGGGAGGHGGFVWGSSRYPHSMGGTNLLIGGKKGHGGHGSHGGSGKDGCILIYYAKE